MTSMFIKILMGEDKVLFYILLILAFASGYFSFSGLSLDANGFLETAKFSVFAIATGLLIFLFWHYALQMVPTYKKTRQIIMAWLAVILGIFLILAASCFQNAAGIAGKDAQEFHTISYINAAETMLDEQYKQTLLVAGIASDLGGHAERYEGFADSEFQRGEFSLTRGGTGAVHRSLLSTEGRFKALSKTASIFIKDADKHHKVISKHLAEMRGIRLLDKPIDERMRLIGQNSDAIQQSFAKMNPSNFAASLLRTAELIPSDLETPTTLSRNANVAKAQEVAIGQLQDDLERTSESLAAFAQEIIQAPSPSLMRFEAVSASKAILSHWDQFIPHIIASIAIDLAALPLLIFMSIALCGRNESEIDALRFKSMTVKQIHDAKKAQEVLRQTKWRSREMEFENGGKVGASSNGDLT